MAKSSGGNCDFVQEGDSISEKVIPQLQSSFHSPLTSIEIHIEGSDSFEVSPFPMVNVDSILNEAVALGNDSVKIGNRIGKF